MNLKLTTFFMLCTGLFNVLYAQSNCSSALVIDACNHTPTEYSPVGNDASFNQGSCDFDGDDAIWISFTVTTNASNVTITLSDWGGCGSFCTTDVTGAFYSGTCGALSAVNNCIDLTTGFTNGTNLGPWTFPVSIGNTYYFRLSEEDDQGGFAELLFELDDCTVPFPVELISFDGSLEKQGNLIQWETASEEDTEWHIIERSEDGETDWEEVARIPAAGYSIAMEQYEWMDQTPLFQSYYRLTTVDFSGEQSYSEVIFLDRPIVKNTLNKVFPNPTRSAITIEYSTIESQDVAIAIYNMTGSLVWSTQATSQKGINQVDYNMSHLANGMYVVRLITPTEQFNQQVVLNQ